MSRTPARFTQADVARTIRAAIQAGASGVEVRPDGTIFVHLSVVHAGGKPAPASYLLRDATGSAGTDIVREIIEIVRAVATGLPPEPLDPLDDGLPGG